MNEDSFFLYREYDFFRSLRDRFLPISLKDVDINKDNIKKHLRKIHIFLDLLVAGNGEAAVSYSSNEYGVAFNGEQRVGFKKLNKSDLPDLISSDKIKKYQTGSIFLYQGGKLEELKIDFNKTYVIGLVDGRFKLIELTPDLFPRDLLEERLAKLIESKRKLKWKNMHNSLKKKIFTIYNEFLLKKHQQKREL